MDRRPAITRLPRHRPQAITSLTEPPDIIFAAEERIAAPAREPGWHPWAWGAALLLHVLALTLALYMREKPLPQAQEAPSSVSVVLDNGGAPQTTAPPAPTQGPPQPMQSQVAPPPPPPPAQAQPEVNLNVPENLLAMLPPPPPRPHIVPHPRPAPPHNYVMLLHGMSYGNPSPAAPAPPAHQAMNLQLPQSDAQAVMGPELTIKGDIGADWMSALSDWVNAHKYYPAQAAEQGQQGTAEVEFTVDRHGNVTGLRLLSSSDSNFLDLAWQGLFQGAQLPPFPPGTAADHITVDATMHYIIGP